jgi:hypothetical protein
MKLIAFIILLVLGIGAASAANVDPYKMLQGTQMVPTGAPWVASDQPMYFGTAKNVSLMYNSTNNTLQLTGRISFDADLVYAANNDTQANIRQLQIDLGANDTKMTKADAAINVTVRSNVTKINTLRADVNDNATKVTSVRADLTNNTTRIATLENTAQYFETLTGARKGVNITVTGIRAGNTINGMVYYNETSKAWSNVGSEFHIVTNDKINNSGGSTNTSLGVLLLSWSKYNSPG